MHVRKVSQIRRSFILNGKGNRSLLPLFPHFDLFLNDNSFTITSVTKRLDTLRCKQSA